MDLLTGPVEALGDFAVFALRAGVGLLGRSCRTEFVPLCFTVGVQSVGVVMITGMFIGMVLAVQAYGQFHLLRMESMLGPMINISVIRELGPVLAATMLAGRVGSAMAAELGTMRVTEQIDAVACLGVNPIHHLVSPRLLASLAMVPLLTVLANLAGVLGGALVCVEVYGIDPHYYWDHRGDFGGTWDIFSGLAKSLVFGGVISLVASHRGFHSRAGAAGVGRAATEAFVVSFVAILAIDFVLAVGLNALGEAIWPPHTYADGGGS